MPSGESGIHPISRLLMALAVQMPHRRADRPLNLHMDDWTGVRFTGDGEWHSRKHEVQGRCQWRKMHLATGGYDNLELLPVSWTRRLDRDQGTGEWI